MIKNFLSFLFGVFVGISGTFLHNAYRPFGLIASLVALLLGGYLVREMYRSRLSSWLYLFGWLVLVFRASSVGNGGEILIDGNVYGNIFIFVGFAFILVFTIRARKIN